MNILPVNNVNTNFKANVSKDFRAAAENLLLHPKDQRMASAKKHNSFMHAIKRFGKFGNSETLITLKKEFKDGKKTFSLYAEENGKEPILLTSKDSFRKVVEKFTHINEYEYNLKTNKK